MSLYKGSQLISGAIPNSANQSLSNLDSAGQDKFDAKANTSLSNLTSTSSTNFDGQWESVSNTQVVTAVNVNGSTNLSYTLTDVPNDGYKYEVLLSGQSWTTATSGSSCGLRISSSLISTIELCGCVTRTSSQVGARGSAIIPIDTDRKIIVHRDTTWTGSINLWLRGYRRIGTNS